MTLAYNLALATTLALMATTVQAEGYSTYTDTDAEAAITTTEETYIPADYTADEAAAEESIDHSMTHAMDDAAHSEHMLEETETEATEEETTEETEEGSGY